MIGDTKLWDAMVASLKKLDTIKVRVGIWSGAGSKSTDQGAPIDLIDLAVIHEYGSGTIPARPFLRGTFEAPAVKAELATLQTKIVKAYIANKINTAKAGEILGLWSANAVKNFVKLGASPLAPLSPRTIAAKKSSRPLVDTGQLINSVTYVVVA